MLQKWGAIKPSSASEPERRWATPFNRPLPLSWWELDGARRECIQRQVPMDDEAVRAYRQAPPCAFDEQLARAAAEELAAPRLAPRHAEQAPRERRAKPFAERLRAEL